MPGNRGRQSRKAMEVEYESANSGCSGAFERRRETSTTGGVEEKEEIWAVKLDYLQATCKILCAGMFSGLKRPPGERRASEEGSIPSSSPHITCGPTPRAKSFTMSESQDITV